MFFLNLLNKKWVGLYWIILLEYWVPKRLWWQPSVTQRSPCCAGFTIWFFRDYEEAQTGKPVPNQPVSWNDIAGFQGGSLFRDESKPIIPNVDGMNILLSYSPGHKPTIFAIPYWSNTKQAQVCVSACTGFRKFVILNEQRAMRPAPMHPGAMVVGTPGGQGAVVGTPVQVPGKLVT